MRDRRQLMNRMGKKFLDTESGAAAIICAGLLVVFIGFGALAIDYGNIVYVRRELTKAAEAGALSGARRLWPLDLHAATSRTATWNTGETGAETTAKANLPTPKDTDVFTDVVKVYAGRWDYIDKFTEGHVNPNAVRVIITRSHVPTIFAQALSVLVMKAPSPINITRGATAIMDYTTNVGGGSLPIAVNLNKANTPGSSITIALNPDTTDNGGWFNVSPRKVNKPNLMDYILNKSCPPLHGGGDNIGTELELNNGVIVPVLDEIYDELHKILLTHPEGWEVVLPVIATDKFIQTDFIDSFVTVMITEVKKQGSPKYVKGIVKSMGESQWGLSGPGSPGVNIATNPNGVLAPPKLVNDPEIPL